MRTLHTDFLGHLQSSVTTLATCGFLTRADGTVMGFTNLDRDLEIEGLTYLAAQSFNSTATRQSEGMAVDNLDLSTFYFELGITAFDLKLGKYDKAKFVIFKVNYLDLPESLDETPPKFLLLSSGLVGQVKRSENSFSIEARGLTQYLQGQQGDLTSKTCRYNFGDSLCSVNLTGQTSTLTVLSTPDRRRLRLSANVDNAVGGKVIFANGAVMAIAEVAGDVVVFYEPMVFEVANGDSLMVVNGCLKTLPACKSYDNAVNFGGEPTIPGADVYLSGAL